MKSFLRNQRGFTLIEVLVVVIIVAILAAIAVPIYMRYVKTARSTEAQSAISAIRTAYRVCQQNYGSTENYTMEQAMKDAQLGSATLDNWTFEVVGNPPKKFIAVSTAEYSGGEGHQVVYDVKDAKFTGYGIYGQTEEEDTDTEDDDVEI